jgi:hypothetical protein
MQTIDCAISEFLRNTRVKWTGKKVHGAAWCSCSNLSWITNFVAEVFFPQIPVETGQDSL